MQLRAEIMDQTTIGSTSATGNGMTGSTPVLSILLYFRERLDTITADVVTLMRGISGTDFEAISELEAEIRDAYGWPDLNGAHEADPDASHVIPPIWEAPRTAYLLTAAIADGDQAEADALWKPLDRNAQTDLLLALAAQLTHHLRMALADTGADRYSLAGALARLSVDAAIARRLPRDVFAGMCRETAGKPA